MRAVLWSWLSPADRVKALTACLASPLAHARFIAMAIAMADDNDKDKVGVLIDMGGGKWTAHAAIWPDDLIRGVRTGESTK